MESLEKFLWERLRLKVNRDKSAVARPWRRKFLGYSVTVHRTPRLKVAPESVKRLKEKLKLVLRRGRGRRLERLIACGLDEVAASVSAYNGHGPWWNAGASHMNRAIPTRYLRAHGLLSFLDEHRRLACSS